MLIRILITAGLVATTGLGLSAGIVYLDKLSRRQQITEDMDGIFRSAIAIPVAKIEQSGGPYQFAIEHLSVSPVERVDAFITNNLNAPDRFQSVFGIPIQIDAGEVGTSRTFIGLELAYKFEIFAFGTTPGDYELVTGPIRLSDVAYYRISIEPVLKEELKGRPRQRGAHQIISL